MSDFDDNPFGQETSPQVVFGVKSTTSRPVNTLQPTLDSSSNPFGEKIEDTEISSNHTDERVAGNSYDNSMPWYSSGSTVHSDQNAIHARSSNSVQQSNRIERKENSSNVFTINVDRRTELEKEYASLENTAAQGIVNPDIDKSNNWPPFPTWTKIKPCFHHDIDVDIPSHYQRTVKTLYRLWIAYVLVMTLNLIDGLIALCIGFGKGNGVSFGLALLYWAFCIPSSFVCWFRPAYKAFRDDGSIRFMIFFFVFFVQCCFTTFVALGIGNLGVFGWINGIDQFTKGTAKNYFMGTCCLITALCSSLVTVISVIMLIRIHRVYRYSGNSIAKAKEEFSTGLVRNKTVQDVATAAATEVVNSQLQN